MIDRGPQVFANISQLASLQGAWRKDGRNLRPSDMDIIDNAAVVFEPQEILWVGKYSDIPKKYAALPTTNMQGKSVLPEIVDCHTHLIFAGDRSCEHSMRLNGLSYQKIAASGGGITSTVSATNDASLEVLESLATTRLRKIHSYGIGTIEIKSGYGLNLDKELEISKLIDRLKHKFHPSIQIKNTFMAAHAVPKNYRSSNEYLTQIVIPLMQRLAQEKIIDAVDIFHEENYFNHKDVEQLFDEAHKLNLSIKIHADEFNDNKGAIIACKYNALSADHLLKTTEDGISTLAHSSTVATLLPGTSLFLGKPHTNARKFLDAGAKVAIASDYNPGSCNFDNVLALASMSAPRYGMNCCELWAAITLNAAHALGLKQQGAICPGLIPRFSIFDTNCIDKITYDWGNQYAINLESAS